MATTTAPATAAAAASTSSLPLRRSVSPSHLRLPARPPPPPRPLRGASLSVVALHKRNPKRLKYASQGQFTRGDAGMLRVQVEPSGEDSWKLDPVIELINLGAVGIIPTDTVYAHALTLSRYGLGRWRQNLPDFAVDSCDTHVYTPV
uniref:YrdC-like domain-containing protein n=1 Tax=Leersia perrieri TaxID=77586 RepID=A0A0D9XA49_9ORYZ